MKICKNCFAKFEIFPEDQDFYNLIKVPEPTFCPGCRRIRRYSYRNQNVYYKSKCDLCRESVISMFPADSEYKVACQKCWWGDSFDPLKYGRNYDFSRGFFEQMSDLLHDVSLPNLVIGSCENSDYTNFSWKNKNCYLLGGSDFCEDCYFSAYLFRCSNCLDCLFVSDSELIYQCVDCQHCYSCTFSQNCQNSNDLNFCFDCRGCENCLGCVGLRKKKYCIFNKEYSQSEYEKKKEEFFVSHTDMNKLRKEFYEFKLKFPHLYAQIERCENCTGDQLIFCKNCFDSYDLIECEDCRYADQSIGAKDGVDVMGIAGAELMYETSGTPENYNIRFCCGIWPKATEIEYCIFSRAVNYCFGCVSLLKNKFCVLNKQYSEGEYKKLVEKIVKKMKDDGEYGEFFPTKFSPFAYNETVAYDYLSLEKEQILAKGWKWRDEEMVKFEGEMSEIPEDEFGEEILDQVFVCEESGEPFKIIPQEYRFYKKMKLPLPKRSPKQRYKDRVKLRNPRMTWKRKCEKCGVEVESSFDLKRAEKIYCKKCYYGMIY